MKRPLLITIIFVIGMTMFVGGVFEALFVEHQDPQSAMAKIMFGLAVMGIVTMICKS